MFSNKLRAFFLGLALWLCATAHTIAATVTTVGSAVDTSSAATVTLTTGVNVPAGATIVIAVSEGNATISAQTIGGSLSDGTNTYTAAAGQLSNNINTRGFGRLWYSTIAGQLNSGTNIVYTKKAAANNTAFAVLYITGLAASPFDSAVTATAGGSSTTPSVTSGTPSQSGEVFIGMDAYMNDAVTSTQASGWSTPFGDIKTSSGTSNNGDLIGGYQINAGSGTLTYNPTHGSSSNWAALVIGFKAAAAASAGRRALMGVGQ